MAKKKESRADQVRAAVEQAFEATTHGASPVRERAQELAEELVGAAARFREVIEELRPPTGDELGDLRARLEALERKVADLEAEKAAAAKPRAAKPAAAKAPRATGTSSGAKGASASPGASTAKRGRAAATPRKPRGGTSGS